MQIPNGLLAAPWRVPASNLFGAEGAWHCADATQRLPPWEGLVIGTDLPLLAWLLEAGTPGDFPFPDYMKGETGYDSEHCLSGRGPARV